MASWLRTFALFALLIAVPFFVERYFGRHSRGVFDGIDEKWVNTTFWEAASYGGFVIVAILLVGFLALIAFYLPQTTPISEYLTLAEREMNLLLRAWGGGLSADARKKMAQERADWLQMIPSGKADAVSELYKMFYDTNQKELGGGAQGENLGKARYTAFLLREIYEGNVRAAQLKVFNDVKNGAKPTIVPGVSEIIGYDKFDQKTGFPPDAGVGWFPLFLTVKINRYPHNIKMVKAAGPDGVKPVVRNWDVIRELTIAQ